MNKGGASRARVGGPEIDLGVESMTDEHKRLDQARQDVFDQVPGMPIFIRLRVFRMLEHQDLSVEQAVSVAHEMIQLFETGKDHGEHQALYARNPEGWRWGKAVHLHKMWDMLILEYTKDDEYFYAAQTDDRHWGKARSDMHAAIADALGFKHDGNMSQAGEFFIRMLGIEE